MAIPNEPEYVLKNPNKTILNLPNDEKNNIKMYKKQMQLRYGLTQHDFEIILNSYNFDIGSSRSQIRKPYFFTHSDYKCNEHEGIFYPDTPVKKVLYPQGYRPEMRILERELKNLTEH